MNRYLIVEAIRYVVLAAIGFQAAVSLVTVIVGWVIIEYNEWGIYPEPSNFLEKGQNLIMYGFAGFAIYTYRKAEQEFSNGFVRKAVHLLAFIALMIVGGIIYYAMYGTLKFVFY
ncbi:hypothetical protein LCM20_09175 [Halobacillus litoralis]|uniref:hypothetical protein n=1 Tax=Halobacillus litoralis TaxID=45668 RepID=UPI001CD43E4B|nr:hypothetical protein [Halobacillus litoralis]MCA0970759.1 hypothetical protein [Halobacillus litoralis]